MQAYISLFLCIFLIKHYLQSNSGTQGVRQSDKNKHLSEQKQRKKY